MTLFDATPFDQQRARRRNTIIGIIIAAIIIAFAVYFYRPYYVARSTVTHFMNAVVRGNFQEAYFIWKPDPRQYTMDQFMQDWGPSSEWGIIKTYHIDEVTEPPGGNSSGLVVLVRINGIHADARLWVEKKTGEMTFYQF